jgi:putative peptide zinc metalloprotease protein
MNESLFSQHWFRISELHPQLRSHVQLERHCYRSEIWYVLKDPLSGRQHRVNSAAYNVVGRLDGRRTVQEIWDICIEKMGDMAPSQGEVIELLGTLGDAALIQTEASPDVAQLFEQREKRAKSQARQRLNPLAFKVALGNPTKLLNAFAPLFSGLLRPRVAYIWMAIVIVSALFAGSMWNEIYAYSRLNLSTSRMMMMMWLAYPIAKLLHEMSHGLAVRVWGGEVKEYGVTLLAFFPVPFVDVTAASGFKSKQQRVFVSLIGVMSELFLAVIAFTIWCNVSDGLLREFLFAIMLTCTLSTLLINGNPLMRFDAYYALADQLESPGLAQRSNALLLHIGKRAVLGVKHMNPPSVSKDEHGWLLVYGISALIYKMIVSVLMANWLAEFSFGLTCLFIFWTGYLLVLKPLYGLVKFLLSNSVASQRPRAIGGAALVTLTVIAITAWLPLPHVTRSEGVVWVPEQSRLRAQADGFVQKVLVDDQAIVKVGDPILQLEDPVLRSDQLRASARLEALEANYQLALSKSSADVGPLSDDIERSKLEIQRFEARVALLTLRAEASGKLALSRAADLPGGYLAKGALIGHIIEPGKTVVRAVLTQADIGLINSSVEAVAVKLAEQNLESKQATIVNQTPASTRELPSAALGEKGGGSFQTDPGDERGLQLVLPVFVLDVRLDDEPLRRIGGRAWVRFDHGSQPLLTQWTRGLRQVFLKHLGNDRA